MKKYLLCFVLLIVGCQTNLQRDYVESDESTYELVKPAIEKWLLDEPGNVVATPEGVEDWHMKLHSWGFKIKEAKRVLAEQEKD